MGSPGAAPTRAGMMTRPVYSLLLLVLLGGVVYAVALRGPFIYDDYSAVRHNEHVHRIWPLDGLLATDPETPLKARPVVALTFALNWWLHGESVTGYHVVNVTIHVLCGLVLYGLVRRTLLGLAVVGGAAGRAARGVAAADANVNGEQTASRANLLALSVAVLWLVHPLNTETVNYVTQRTESLMALFYVLTLYCSIRALHGEGRRWWSVLAVSCCVLGMGSKETMVTAPLLVVLYDWSYHDGGWREACRRRWGLYAGLCSTWLLLGLLMWYLPRSETVGVHLSVSGWTYLLNQCWVLSRYLRLVFWPFGLLLDYGEPVVSITLNEVWLRGLLLVVLVTGSLVLLCRRSRLGYPLAWVFLVLAPTSTLVPIVTEVGAERRMYLPLMGVMVVVVAVAWWLVRRVPRGGAVAVMVIAALLAARTVDRNLEYRLASVLWRTVLVQRPNSARVHDNLGVALRAEGRTAEAIRHYRRALELDPDNMDSHHNLGNALLSQGRRDEALDHYLREFQIAVRERPDLALSWAGLGWALAQKGEAAQAAAAYQRSLLRGLADTEKLFEATNFVRKVGQPGEARLAYERALANRADLPGLHNNFGTLLGEQGDIDAAIRQFEAALELDPHHADAAANLAQALQLKERFSP